MALSAEGEVPVRRQLKKAPEACDLRRKKTSPPVSCACAVALPYESAGVAAIHLTLVVARVRTLRRGSPHKGSPVFLRRAPERITTTPKGLRRGPEDTVETLRGNRIGGGILRRACAGTTNPSGRFGRALPKRAHGRGRIACAWGEMIVPIRPGRFETLNQRRGRD